MSYLGRFQVGHMVPLTFGCRDSQGTPTLPIASPRASITKIGGSTKASLLIPIIDSARVTGLFHEELILGSEYDAGRYLVLWEANVSGSLYYETAVFEVVGGGDPNSYVQSMAAWQRPEVAHVVMQTANGRYRYGQNPTIPTQEV